MTGYVVGLHEVLAWNTSVSQASYSHTLFATYTLTLCFPLTPSVAESSPFTLITAVCCFASRRSLFLCIVASIRVLLRLRFTEVLHLACLFARLPCPPSNMRAIITATLIAGFLLISLTTGELVERAVSCASVTKSCSTAYGYCSRYLDIRPQRTTVKVTVSTYVSARLLTLFIGALHKPVRY